VLNAWDAWDDAHRDEAVGAGHQHLAVPEDGDAERSADPVRGGLALDAWFPSGHRRGRLGPVARLDAAAPYIPDAVLSAEQSYAAQDSAVSVDRPVSPDAERSEELEARAAPKP
jgi:hypothetical protein